MKKQLEILSKILVGLGYTRYYHNESDDGFSIHFHKENIYVYIEHGRFEKEREISISFDDIRDNRFIRYKENIEETYSYDKISEIINKGIRAFNELKK